MVVIVMVAVVEVVVLVMVAVELVMVVVVVVVVVLMSNDLSGDWRWSIIHCLRVIHRRKPQLVGCKPLVLVVV